MNMTAPGTNRTSTNRTKGFSFIEVLMVVIVTGTLIAFAVPALTTLLQSMRSNGDARDVDDVIALAKMRAAADFTRTRVYCDLSQETFEVDRWTAGAWSNESGTQPLSKGVTFGFGANVTTSPSGAAITQAPLCYDSGDAATVANTACIVFNSRGIPVNHSGAPIATDALYVTDGSSVYGVTVLATGLIRIWRTGATAAHWAIR